MAKMLAADTSWQLAEACLQTHGGLGFAEEVDVERKFRETRLYQGASISTNLILSYIAESMCSACLGPIRHHRFCHSAASRLPLPATSATPNSLESARAMPRTYSSTNSAPLSAVATFAEQSAPEDGTQAGLTG